MTITLTGITKVQKNAMIWAYQVDGSFTSDEFKACWNVRTLFALQHKRVILFNPSTGHYYFNPDYAREIRAKLESWGVFLCDYADDFGAWFDAHIESARQPDPLPEPPIDPEDTPILPMTPISDDETLPPDEWFFDRARERERDGKDDPYNASWEYGRGGGDPLGWMTHFRPDPAKVRADYQAGYLLMRRMVGDGWTKQDVIRFVHKFFSPSAAFIAGCESYVYRNYRDYVRYFNEYHWQNDVARVGFENRPARPIIDRIPF